MGRTEGYRKVLERRDLELLEKRICIGYTEKGRREEKES